MHVAIGSDHRGYRVKTALVKLIEHLGHTVDDEGTHDDRSVDYPDIAAIVAGRVARGEVERGILICGSGVGMAMAANKIAGIRAAPCHDDMSAEMSRRHNNANVLCLSADMLGQTLIDRIVEIWLATAFDAGRHARRVEKIAGLESPGRSARADAPPAEHSV